MYEASVKKICFEADLTKSEVQEGLDIFEKEGKVIYVNGYVFLVNFMRNQNFNLNKRKSAIAVYNELPASFGLQKIEYKKESAIQDFENIKNILIEFS